MCLLEHKWAVAIGVTSSSSQAKLVNALDNGLDRNPVVLNDTLQQSAVCIDNRQGKKAKQASHDLLLSRCRTLN